MRKKVAIIGGSQTASLKSLAKKQGIEIIHHPGRIISGSVRKHFYPIIRKVDAVVLLNGALCHASMWKAKEIANELGKPIGFHKSRGGSGAMMLAKSL